MNWNLFWGCYCLFFAVFIFILSYFLVFQRFRKDSDCTEKVIGEVVDFSFVQYNGINLPIVVYPVNGKIYRVVGPKFKGSVRTTTRSPVSHPNSQVDTHGMTRENLPQILTFSVVGNSFVSITKSPLLDLFPVGSTVTVYYNPRNPKHAYAERPLDPPAKWAVFSMWFLILSLVIGALFLFFGPRLPIS